MTEKRNVTSRVSVTEETRDRLKDFASGLGETYEVAINFLLDGVSEPGESPIAAGYRLREQIRAWLEEQEAEVRD